MTARLSTLLGCAALVAAFVQASGAAPPAFHDLFDGSPRTVSALSGAPHAVVVWKASCAPCVAELAQLHAIAARAPDWRFVTLALDDGATAKAALPDGARFAAAWIARGQPGAVLAALNPMEPALPLTVAIDRRGRVCARRVGLLGSDILQAWSAQCSR